MNRWVVAVLCGVVAAALGGVAWADEAKEPQGKTLFLKYKCNSCHSVEAVGIAKKAVAEEKEEVAVTATATPAAPKKKPPDLSGVGLDVKADWIVKFMKKLETTKAGKKHMKLWKGTDKELQEVASWLETMKTAKAEKAREKVTGSEKAEKAEPAEKTEAAEKADTTKAAPETGTK